MKWITNHNPETCPDCNPPEEKWHAELSEAVCPECYAFVEVDTISCPICGFDGRLESYDDREES